jgi:hypothetical protein
LASTGHFGFFPTLPSKKFTGDSGPCRKGKIFAKPFTQDPDPCLEGSFSLTLLKRNKNGLAKNFHLRIAKRQKIKII